MIHIMENDWELESIGPARIITSKLYPLIKYKKLNPIELYLDEVAYKPLDNIDVDSVRYKLADINYPLFVIEGMHNPYNKPYRLIDGRHRLLKQLNEGKTKFLFYIFTIDDINHYIERI